MWVSPDLPRRRPAPARDCQGRRPASACYRNEQEAETEETEPAIERQPWVASGPRQPQRTRRHRQHDRGGCTVAGGRLTTEPVVSDSRSDVLHRGRPERGALRQRRALADLQNRDGTDVTELVIVNLHVQQIDFPAVLHDVGVRQRRPRRAGGWAHTLRYRNADR